MKRCRFGNRRVGNDAAPRRVLLPKDAQYMEEDDLAHCFSPRRFFPTASRRTAPKIGCGGRGYRVSRMAR